jgi:hypothetical protein
MVVVLMLCVNNDEYQELLKNPLFVRFDPLPGGKLSKGDRMKVPKQGAIFKGMLKKKEVWLI